MNPEYPYNLDIKYTGITGCIKGIISADAKIRATEGRRVPIVAEETSLAKEGGGSVARHEPMYFASKDTHLYR